MNIFTLVEPTPTLSFAGGASLSLVEPLPLFSSDGNEGASFALIEPFPGITFAGVSGNFALTEPFPTIDFGGVWLSTGNFALKEPLPIFAFTGQKASTLTLVEPLPKLSLNSYIPGTLRLTEPIPLLDMIGGSTGQVVSFAFDEPIPILNLIGFAVVSPDASIPVDPESGEIRPLSDYTAWSVNVKNGAHAGFTNYEFSSLLYFNGKYYGTRDDGLFELAGDDDNGAKIVTSNRWGASDHGTAYPKRFHHSDVECRSRNAGTMILKIYADEEDSKSFPFDPGELGRKGLHNQVVRGRRDLLGTEITPEIVNVDGGDWEVNGFEINMQTLPRRK